MKKDIEVEVEALEALIKEIDISADARKSILKQVAVVRKTIKPRKAARKHNPNSGLQKPLIISKEMADFAGWDQAELHSRVEVTKVICAYVNANKLQKPDNKRIIVLDKNLKKILHHDGDEITYPHIQKYIGVHFTKPAPEEIEEEVVVAKKEDTKKEGTKKEKIIKPKKEGKKKD